MGFWPLTSRSRTVSSRPPKQRRPLLYQRFTFTTRRSVWTFVHLGACGVDYHSRVGSDGEQCIYIDGGDYTEHLKMKKRTVPGNSGGAKHLAPLESDIMAQCHALVKHMALTQYDDGDQRKPGWITIKTFGSSWQIEIKDPDSCLALRVMGPTLDECLALATLLLESDEAPWEPDTWLQQQAAKNRKKG